VKKDVEMAEYYDIQIRDCRYALEAKKKPVRVLSELFAILAERFTPEQ